MSLLKLAQITDGNPIDRRAYIIAPPQKVDSIKMAFPTRLVSGIEETPLAEIKITKIEILTHLTDFPTSMALIDVVDPTKETPTDTQQKEKIPETKNDKGGE